MSNDEAKAPVTHPDHFTIEQMEQQTEPGEILEFQHKDNTHYALYLGKGRVMSIDTKTERKTNEAYIQERTLHDVCRDGKVQVKNHDNVAQLHFQVTPRHSRQTVKVAMFYQDRVVPFEFDFRNSEYYCTLWRYGKGFSTQVEKQASKEAKFSFEEEYSRYKRLAMYEHQPYSHDCY